MEEVEEVGTLGGATTTEATTTIMGETITISAMATGAIISGTATATIGAVRNPCHALRIQAVIMRSWVVAEYSANG